MKGWHSSVPFEKDDENETMECDRGRTQKKMGCCYDDNPAYGASVASGSILYSTLDVLLCLSKVLTLKDLADESQLLCAFAEN